KLTGEDIAARLHWSAAKVSRLESGRVGIQAGDVLELLDVYGITDPATRDALVTVARQSRQKGWWHTFSDVLPAWFAVFVGLESAACALRISDPARVDGLRQPGAHARALPRAAPPDGAPPAEEIERRVALRMARQRVLDRDNPPQLTILLSEVALRLELGGSD